MYWTGTSLKLRPMQGVFSNANAKFTLLPEHGRPIGIVVNLTQRQMLSQCLLAFLHQNMYVNIYMYHQMRNVTWQPNYICMASCKILSYPIRVCVRNMTILSKLYQIAIILFFVLQHSVVDDPVSEAVCIIANTDKW